MPVNFTEVGIFTTGTTIAQLWYFIPTIITQSVYPSLLKIRKESQALFFEKLQRLNDYFTWFSIFFALIITFSSQFIIAFLYGPAFIGSAVILSIDIWVGVFVFVGNVYSAVPFG